jgi:hypothetical protein
MAGTAYAWSPDYLATGGDVKAIYTNFPGTATQVIYGVHSFTNVGSANFTPTKAPPRSSTWSLAVAVAVVRPAVVVAAAAAVQVGIALPSPTSCPAATPTPRSA